MKEIQTSNITKGITNNTDNEPVTKGFLMEFMTEFKRDLFEMFDIRFEKVDKRFDALEGRVDNVERRLGTVENTMTEMNIRQKETNKNIEEIKTTLEKQISRNAVEHIKFDSRLDVPEQA